jgi:pyruvate dehydrogenase E2 component (dihydrolipoamide acetyltransferase)
VAAPPRERSGRSVSPAARRRARELGVDVEAIEGTGTGGRVGVEDVERAAQTNGGGA